MTEVKSKNVFFLRTKPVVKKVVKKLTMESITEQLAVEQKRLSKELKQLLGKKFYVNVGLTTFKSHLKNSLIIKIISIPKEKVNPKFPLHRFSDENQFIKVDFWYNYFPYNYTKTKIKKFHLYTISDKGSENFKVKWKGKKYNTAKEMADKFLEYIKANAEIMKKLAAE